MQRRTAIQKSIAAAALAIALPASAQAPAQDYPSKPVRILIAFKSGGAVDIVARTIGQQLQQTLGQPFVIEYKPGAATNIAMKAMIDATPDGHTLMLTANNAAINPELFTPPPFDPEKDFVPVSLVGRVPVVIAAHPSFPASTPGELVKLAKEKPNAISFGSPGNASTPHLAVELFTSSAGIQLRHVPYQGGAQAINDVLGGHIPVVATNALEISPVAKAGTIKVLAALSAQRIPTMPNVPTIAESGFPGFEATVWYGFLAPKGTPQAIVNKLHGAIQKALATQEVQNRMGQVGGTVSPGSVDTFTALLRSERERYGKLIKATGIKPGAD
ncbi:Bug family tripartite tricarboxylate transporter substrate binding protein [Hydrogenophaga sp. BPS33]|uniref:Bug family tripartite tricarboxylate transporter substrate binding protein n=1 Tax=Hydrogenophaga sp. BPS33 TaxID=2651974 RepID=UPI00131F82C9|nr:tripartite tricarboxylate transporter substrate binding protein [Hydrogenophaga sp. BPS33]QHE88444.1 tripartite tricarboxylate transporter substrate binding protein [Hydrogenophaga sp. BPS33]